VVVRILLLLVLMSRLAVAQVPTPDTTDRPFCTYGLPASDPSLRRCKPHPITHDSTITGKYTRRCLYVGPSGAFYVDQEDLPKWQEQDKSK